MTSEYTTYGCPACGMQHRAGNGGYGEICPDLKKALMRLTAWEGATETRVREIAREEIASYLKTDAAYSHFAARAEMSLRSLADRTGVREAVALIAREEARAELRKVDHAICEIEANAAHNIYEEELRKARDSALEEAAEVCEGGHCTSLASDIRSLKSQPAAPVVGTCATCGFFRVKGEPHECKPAAQASAPQIVGTSCVGWADPLKHEALLLENSELRTERDDLRAKLTAAEKAIKDAYDAVPFGWRDEDGYRYLKAVLLILSEHLRIGRKEESK